jgi:hypothetical protein
MCHWAFVFRIHNAASRIFRVGTGFRPGQILLQKSKVEGLRICRENTKQEAIADSYNFSRVTEVACEFGVGR